MLLLKSAIAFILLLTLLIILHELGHYILARIFKVDVEEFGFGLPPKIATIFHRGMTAFTINLIPFGGFVRLKGESAVGTDERFAPGSFASKGALPRLLILSGGVFMNFLLAFVLLVAGFSYWKWVPSFYSDLESVKAAAARGEVVMEVGVVISEVLPDGTAAKAGVLKDSIIEAIDGVTVNDPDDVIAFQKGKTSVMYRLRQGKDGAPLDVTVPLSEGKSGVAISPLYQLSSPKRSLSTAARLALLETKFMIVQTVKGLGNLTYSLVTTGKVPDGITGIVGIAVMTHASVQTGYLQYLNLVAMLSLSLAILNILPLPALDGGRIMFVFLELILRKPLNQKFELMTNAIGFALLLTLIVVITFNDVIHLF